MANLQQLRELTVSQIEAYADAPDDEMMQTLVLDSIDEEIRAVRREYEAVIKAAELLLAGTDARLDKCPTIAMKEKLREAIVSVSTG